MRSEGAQNGKDTATGEGGACGAEDEGGQSGGGSSVGTYSEEHSRLVARMKQVVR